MENTPLPQQENQTPTPASEPAMKNKMTTPVIVILIVILIGGGYFAYQKWQQKRAVNSYLKELGITNTGLFGDNIGKIAEEMAKEEMKQATMSPKEKFVATEAVNVTDANHKKIAEEINNIIEDSFGDSKITGFTSGYMGMNSGSGIIQFMIPRALSGNDINPLRDELADKNYEIIAATQQKDSAAINCQKNGVSYTFGFNNNEQEIMVIIVAMQ